jgi:hypothetical protein
VHTRPSFLLDIPIHDLAEWWLRLECCGRTVDLPGRYLANQKPHARLGDMLERFRCKQCGTPIRQVLIFDDPSNNAGRYPHTGAGWRMVITLPVPPARRTG